MKLQEPIKGWHGVLGFVLAIVSVVTIVFTAGTGSGAIKTKVNAGITRMIEIEKASENAQVQRYDHETRITVLEEQRQDIKEIKTGIKELLER